MPRGPQRKDTVSPAAVAELIGGPFDGMLIGRAGKDWAPFINTGLEFRDDPRRVIYAFIELANGTPQYCFDRRENREPNQARNNSLVE